MAAARYVALNPAPARQRCVGLALVEHSRASGRARQRAGELQ
jgi:hypothetical protein